MYFPSMIASVPTLCQQVETLGEGKIYISFKRLEVQLSQKLKVVSTPVNVDFFSHLSNGTMHFIDLLFCRLELVP